MSTFQKRTASYYGVSCDLSNRDTGQYPIKKSRTRSKTLCLMMLAGAMAGMAQAQSITVLKDGSAAEMKRVHTTRDGTTWDKYISYLKLDGSQSAYLPLDSNRVGQPLDYSVMLWFKPQSNTDEWNSRYQYLFDFTESLECFFTGTGQLMCDSIQKLDKLTVDTAAIGNNQWTHLSIAGSKSQGSYLVLEQNDRELVRSYRDTYIKMQQNTATWRICLGGCDTQYGFVGAFREFKVLNQFVTPESASRLKNNYLLYDGKILSYFRFSSNDFNKDEFRNSYTQIWRKANLNSKNLVQITDLSTVKGRDLMPNDVCFPINEVKTFLNLTSVAVGGAELETMNLESRWKPQAKGWAYSGSLWVKLGTDTCAASKASEALKNCYLVLLQDSFMLYLLPDKNQVALYFFNQRPIFESISKTLFVPQNQWVNIQFAINQFNGYDFRTFDILGRLTGMATENRDLMEQKVTKKELSFFKGFRGVAKSVFVTAERQQLPIVLAAVNNTKGEYYRDDRCLAYILLAPDHVQTPVNGTQYLINYCLPFIGDFLNLTLRLPGQPPRTSNQTNSSALPPPPTQSSYHRDFALLQTDFTRGLLSDPLTHFDGIACEDDSLVPLWINPSSQVKQEVNIGKEITSLYVEYWFRGGNSASTSQEGQMVSIVSNDIEVVSITKGQVIECAYNSTQGERVSAKFSRYEEKFASGSWMHVMCGIGIDGTLTASIKADKDLYNETIKVTGKGVGQFKISPGKSEVILGNTKDANKGYLGLRLREFRLWGKEANLNNLTLWRYRQMDPKASSASSLLTYFRFAEGDLNFYDLASDSFATFSSDLSLIRDSDLLVCPIGTFHSQDQSKCFRDPITHALVTIYPVYRASDDSMGWRFSIEDSQLVNKAYSSEIKAKWEFEDKILRNIAQDSSNKKTYVLPAQAFRESAKYKIRVNMTSDSGDLMFNKVQDLTFVPVSCQYFLVNSRSAFNFRQDYFNQQSTENITFTLNLVNAKPYCNEIAFYQDINAQMLKYQMVYDEDHESQYGSPRLLTQWDERAKQFVITLPKTEQYKLPLFKDIKFIFSLPWENKENSDIFPANNLVFQHAMITFNFQKEGSVLIPSLETKTPIILGDETAIFDASGSFITYRAFGEQKTGLKFIWQCPIGLEGPCSREQFSILNIQYKDFLDSKLLFNTTYTFNLRMEWTNRVNNIDVLEFSELSTQALWLNYSVPSFEIERPAHILMTADSNRFSANLVNNQIPDLSIHDVEWSIVPNISMKSLPLTLNKTLLTIPKGIFTTRTSYTITVTITNRQYPSVKKTQSLTFVTAMPPYGGSAKVDPVVGIIGETEFTIQLSNWESDNKPIQYQIWSAQDSGGQVQSKHLTGMWLPDSQEFKFKAINTNPLIVLIRDEVGEEIKAKLVIMVKAPESQLSSSKQESGMLQLRRAGSNMLRKTLSDSMHTGNKYQSMNLVTDFINSLPIVKAQEQTLQNSSFTNLTVQEELIIVLDLLQAYLSNSTAISQEPMIVAIELKALASSIGKMARNITEFLEDRIVNKTLTIISLMMEVIDRDEIRPLLISSSMLNTSEVAHDIYDVMTSLLKFSLQKEDSKSVRRRVLQDQDAEIYTTNMSNNDIANYSTESNSTETVDRINVTAVFEVYYKFNKIICSAIQGKQAIQASEVEIIFDKPLVEDQDLSYNLTKDQKSSLIFNASELSDTLTTLKILTGCLQASYFNFDIFETYEQPDQNLTQISTSLSQVAFNADSSNIEDPIDLKEIVTYIYSMKPSVNLTELHLMIQGLNSTSSNSTLIVNNTTSENYTEEQRDNVTSNGTRRLNTTESDTLEQNTQNFDNEKITPDNETTTSANETITPANETITPSNDTMSNQTVNNANETMADQTISAGNGTMQNSTSSNSTLSEDPLSDQKQKTKKEIVCMAYQKSKGRWEKDMCTTVLKFEQNVVECRCTSVDNLFQGVFLLNMKLPEDQDLSVLTKKPFVAISVIFILLTVLIPIISSILDWKDLDAANLMELKLSIQQRKIHSKILDIQPSLWYWFQNHEQDQSKEALLGQTTQKLSFFGVIKLTHPLLNMFCRYDGQRKSRFFRIMPWLAQSAAFTIVIIFLSDIFFEGTDEEYSLEKGEITENQALRIIEVGFAGIFALLPWPFIQKFIRQGHLEANRVQQSDLEARAKQGAEKQENPIATRKGGEAKFPKAEHLGTEEAMYSEEQTLHQKMSQRRMHDNRPTVINRLLAFLTIVTCVAAVVISVLILGEKRLSIQYCTVASFFMGVFGSLLISHFIYAVWQYILYIGYHDESAALPSTASLQAGFFPSDTGCCQMFLMDQGLLNHKFEQLIIRRATFDANVRTTSSTYQSERVKKSRSDLSVNQPSVTQIQGNPNNLGPSQDLSQLGDNEVPPPMGTIEKDRHGSPFALSAKNAYTGTPNMIGGKDTIDGPTTDRGRVFHINTQGEEPHGYQQSVPIQQEDDREIAPIEIEDDNEQDRSNSFKIPPRQSLENSRQKIDMLQIAQEEGMNPSARGQYIDLGQTERGGKSGRGHETTPEPTQRQLIQTSLRENQDQPVDLRILNSQSRLQISQDDMRASIFNNLKPQPNEIKYRFYQEENQDDQPIYDDMEDGVEPSQGFQNGPTQLKQSTLKEKLKDELTGSQARMSILRQSNNKRASDFGLNRDTNDPHSGVQYSPIRQSKGNIRPKTSVHPTGSFIQQDNAGATTGHAAWMEEAEGSAKHTDFQVPEDNEDIDENDAEILDQE